MVTTNQTSVTLDNVTLAGNLTLPSPAVVYSSGGQLFRADGNDNLFAGINAGIGSPLTGMRNTGLGSAALFRNTSGGYNTAVGFLTLQGNVDGDYNLALGDYALAENNGRGNVASGYQTLSNGTNANDNVADGFQALYNSMNGNNNVVVGYQAMLKSANDSGGMAVGFQALENDNAVNQGSSSGWGENSALGYQSLEANTIGIQNTAEGFQSLFSNTNGSYNTASGCYTLFSNNGGVGNTALGNDALEFNLNGTGNTAAGYNAMHHNSTGNFNEASGYAALPYNTTGDYNTANGVNALYSNVSGSENVADGFQALYSCTNGNGIIALGFQAGYGYNASESDDIAIGNYGVAGESGVIRIGTVGTHYTTHIAGNVGLGGAVPQQTLSLNGGMNIDQASANIGSTAYALTFGFNSGEGIGSTRVSGRTDSYGLNFYTEFNKRMTILQDGNVGIANTNPTTLLVVGGATSPAYCNGTTWVNGSDRNSKQGFTSIDPREVLAKVSALPITQWQYKAEADDTKHLGPMAQDFHAAFALNGADDRHIATVDEEGVALAAIQGLNQKLDEKDAEIQALKQSVAELQQRMQALAAHQ